MPTTKAMLRATIRIEERPTIIADALADLHRARNYLRRCGSKKAADYVAAAIKSAEGAYRHATARRNRT